MWVPHAGHDPAAVSCPWAGWQAPAAAAHTAHCSAGARPEGLPPSRPGDDLGNPGAGSPLPPRPGTAAPVSGQAPPSPPWLWPRLTLLEFASWDPTSQRGHGSRALPARCLWGCPSSTQGGQGAAAMRGGRDAPLRHGHRRDGGHGEAGGHRQVRARAGEGSQASGPASAGGRELPSPSPSPHGGGGRQAGERSPSHMVGWRRSRCPGNS